VFTKSLLRNGFGYPYCNMYMFYPVRNKPLYGEYVLIIYSAQMDVPTYESVLVTFNRLCAQHVSGKSDLI
jgi:hypothetical protein